MAVAAAVQGGGAGATRAGRSSARRRVGRRRRWPGPSCRGCARSRRRRVRPAGRRGGAAALSPRARRFGLGRASNPRPPTHAGQPTDSGYAEDLVPLEQRRWPGLDAWPTWAVRVPPRSPCSTAAATATTRRGPSSARRRRSCGTHPTTVLVTVDLGFNDLLPCLRHEIDRPGLRRRGAGHGARPAQPRFWRGSRRRRRRAPSSSGSATTTRTSGTTSRVRAARPSPPPASPVMERLDADPAGGLSIAPACPWPTSPRPSTSRTTTRCRGPAGPRCPTNVARACALTWMCDPPPLGHNPHPDDAGYRTIAVRHRRGRSPCPPTGPTRAVPGRRRHVRRMSVADDHVRAGSAAAGRRGVGASRDLSPARQGLGQRRPGQQLRQPDAGEEDDRHRDHAHDRPRQVRR